MSEGRESTLRSAQSRLATCIIVHIPFLPFAGVLSDLQHVMKVERKFEIAAATLCFKCEF